MRKSSNRNSHFRSGTSTHAELLASFRQLRTLVVFVRFLASLALLVLCLATAFLLTGPWSEGLMLPIMALAALYGYLAWGWSLRGY